MNAAAAAIQFALEAEDGKSFLRLWNEGEFDVCRRGWPEAPKEVYVGADPMLPETRAMLFQNNGQKAPPEQELCEDEGCPHHGTPHVCVEQAPQATLPVAWQFYDKGEWWTGNDRIPSHRENTAAAGYPVRDLYTFAVAPRTQEAKSVAPVNGVRWDLFPGWLIDHCEGDIVTEEGLQSALADMLASDSYKSAVAAAPQEQAPHLDDIVVDEFAAAMKAKMAEARAKGRSGWQDCTPADLSRMLRDHVEKGDPRDVANFCMMLWHHEEPIGKTREQAPADKDAIRNAVLEEAADFCDEPYPTSNGFGVTAEDRRCAAGIRALKSEVQS